MFTILTIFIQRVSMLTFANVAKADGYIISFVRMGGARGKVSDHQSYLKLIVREM